MPSTVGHFEELGDERHHLAGETGIVGFLRVDAEPGVMGDAEFGRALRLVIGELAEVVVETSAEERSKPAQKAGSQTASQPASASFS